MLRLTVLACSCPLSQCHHSAPRSYASDFFKENRQAVRASPRASPRRTSMTHGMPRVRHGPFSRVPGQAGYVSGTHAHGPARKNGPFGQLSPDTVSLAKKAHFSKKKKKLAKKARVYNSRNKIREDIHPSLHAAGLTLALPLRDACSAPKLPFPDSPPRLFPSPVKMMSGGGYSALDDPKASGSVPVSTHQPLAHRPSLLAPHLSRLAQAATGPDPQTIKFTESNLQTFPPSEAKGKISGAYRPPTDSDGEIRSPPLYCLL